MLAVGGGIAWRLYPVQLLVLADRLSHPVAAPQRVNWADGPSSRPRGQQRPNVILIVADDLAINDVTTEGPGRGVAGEPRAE